MGVQNQTELRWFSAKEQGKIGCKGYVQKPGIECNETFAPVARLDTIQNLDCPCYTKELEAVPARCQIGLSKWEIAGIGICGST